ncbi:MAG: 4-phosphoerythronate dehydrogenase, partial [Bacteroidales bacterium]|nr:4-phosphoerythronate dehydrogenase [Bacteroidales bacterium]
MKIVIDRMIPFVEGVFEPYADVVYLKGEDICHDDIVDADALVIRTRTRCSADMLSGTAVRVIATAAISTDNIDMEYCREHGVFVSNASGSNAGGVMNYVLSA